MLIGVIVYSGEYDVCDVTPSVHPCTPGKLTNLPGHSGNRTRDLSTFPTKKILFEAVGFGFIHIRCFCKL